MIEVTRDVSVLSKFMWWNALEIKFVGDPVNVKKLIKSISIKC